jgi:ubiquinol-cytochrome c reductase cytochrome b subunit
LIFFSGIRNWRTLYNSHPLLRILSNSLFILPTPINISNFWNFGSFLGILLGRQILRGLILASHYTRFRSEAFFSIDHIIRNVEGGWLIRTFHLNGGRFFFIGLYLHMGRGLYYKSYFAQETWNLGVIIFIIRIGIAFLGYVLPWGQIRFWGATVITNLISAIPYIGNYVVQWIWGGFSIRGPTLSRFFMLHFCLPFILRGLVILHLFFLHLIGRTNPLRIPRANNTIFFAPFFWWKDLLFIFLIFIIIFGFILFAPFYLGDPENFILANPLVTPTHIVPEWYFLFAYAILRSIPNKILGVIFLLLSLLILFFPPFFLKEGTSTTFSPLGGVFFFSFCGIFFILTWLGGQVVEEPFLRLGQYFLILYFLIFFLFIIFF